MTAPLYLVEGPWKGLLAIAPAPPPGKRLQQALQSWQRLRVSTVVSLMVPGERPGWEQEEALCRDLNLDFISIPIRDHSIPKPEEMQQLASTLKDIEGRLVAGERVVVHCFAGIGRSGMATVALLMIGGVPLEKAIAQVTEARGLPCPETDEQREWLASFDRFRRVS